MKTIGAYPNYRGNAGVRKIMPFTTDSSKCDVNDIEKVSSEIVIRKRISLTLLLTFIPFITAIYVVASFFDVERTYFISFALGYGIYYLAYSIWACSSHCPNCGHTMSKKYLFIIPFMHCNHCGHDLKNPKAFRRHS